MNKQLLYGVVSLLIIYTSPLVAQERTENGFIKEQRDSHSAHRLKGIEITNQHGPVSISGWNRDTISVEVFISVSTSDEGIATEILDKLNIVTSQKSQKLVYNTIVGDDISFNYPFKIEYRVNVPARAELKIENKFGDVTLNALTGSTELNLIYGKLLQSGIGSLSLLKTHLTFADASLSAFNTGELNLSNSQIEIKEAANITISGAFCQAKIPETEKLTINVSTGRFHIGPVNDLSIKGEYLFPTIEEIIQKGNIEVTNGLVLIKKVSPQLEALSVFNHNAPLNLSLPNELNYTLQGEVKEGHFRHYQAKQFQVIRDGQSISFSGYTGNTDKRATLVLFNQGADINIFPQ